MDRCNPCSHPFTFSCGADKLDFWIFLTKPPHTGALYTYSRCSKPWIVWHCWHANMLMETIWSRTSTAQQELAWGLGPLCTLLQNAFLWVPELIASTVRKDQTPCFLQRAEGGPAGAEPGVYESQHCLSLACLPLLGNKSHLKVIGDLVRSTCGTSAMRSLLKMEWLEVYTAINKLQCGRAGFKMCARLMACGGVSASQKNWRKLCRYCRRCEGKRTDYMVFHP